MQLISLFEKSPSAVPAAAEPFGALPVAVADRFSWPAFVFAPVWLLVNRLWLIGLGFIGLVVLLGLASRWIGGDAAFLAYACLCLLVGLEAAALRRVALARRGYLSVGERMAADADAALLAWLDTPAKGVEP
ncbi:Protein of unknown function [Devosia enhydra]|uniref:DUF2628 domain-containing protein n=1 Tax=Devosia enhydra TaxID=665118 RepID=A0A1K2HYJ1_9HYPH|nr:DUF2628 domain-containing protein [Devosia enhydra]SFZ85044.1 Protein of unknown function [Devosia enhydra]